MIRRKNSTLALVVALLVLASLALHVDQSWAQPEDGNRVAKPSKNQLNSAMNATAKQHKKEGVGRSTTNDDRTAAARRNAARKAAAQQTGNGGATQ